MNNLKNILVTGASGYIGNKLAHMLAGKGFTIHALIRRPSAEALLQHPNIRIFKGDMLDKKSLCSAIAGCDQVYHLAASTKIWIRKPGEITTINAEGTWNVLEAALSAGITKLVYTSSGGFIGPSNGKLLSEDDQPPAEQELEYDASKKKAEGYVGDFVKRGLNAVIVRPTKVFGPGNTGNSYTTNNVISRFLREKFIIIPGPQTYSANFSFIDDVAEGHVLAMEKGQTGEKYLLGGENVSYYDFFNTIRKFNDDKGIIIKAGQPVFSAFARMQELWGKLTGNDPLISRKVVRYLFANHNMSAIKAVNTLGYHITPFEDAMRITINHLKYKNYA